MVLKSRKLIDAMLIIGVLLPTANALSIIKLLAEYIFVLFLFFYSCNSCQLFAANRCFEYIPLSTQCSNNCSIIIHTMNTGN